MIIEKNTQHHKSIECKRLELACITFKDICPLCGREIVVKNPELSYPVINGRTEYIWYCDECDENWTTDIIVSFDVVEAM